MRKRLLVVDFGCDALSQPGTTVIDSMAHADKSTITLFFAVIARWHDQPVRSSSDLGPRTS